MINEITRALNGMSDKVDLKAEKIEFGKLQDLDKEFSKLKSDSDSIAKEAKSAANKLDAVTGGTSALVTKLNKLSSDYDSLKSEFKTLGIDAPKDLVLKQNQILAYVSDLKELDSVVSKASDGIFGVTQGF